MVLRVRCWRWRWRGKAGISWGCCCSSWGYHCPESAEYSDSADSAGLKASWSRFWRLIAGEEENHYCLITTTTVASRTTTAVAKRTTLGTRTTTVATRTVQKSDNNNEDWQQQQGQEPQKEAPHKKSHSTFQSSKASSQSLTIRWSAVTSPKLISTSIMMKIPMNKMKGERIKLATTLSLSSMFSWNFGHFFWFDFL